MRIHRKDPSLKKKRETHAANYVDISSICTVPGTRCSRVARRRESAYNYKSSEISRVLKYLCKFCKKISREFIKCIVIQSAYRPNEFFSLLDLHTRFLIRYFKTFAAPPRFSLLYFAARKERIAVSSHEQTVIITIVRPIGRKIKIPAPPERVLARLSSGKNENGFFH